MTIYNKIIFSSSLVAFLIAFAGFMAWKNMQSIKGIYFNKVTQYHESAQALEAIKTAAQQVQLLALRKEKENLGSDVIATAIKELQTTIHTYQEQGSFKENQSIQEEWTTLAMEYETLGASLLASDNTIAQMQQMNRLETDLNKQVASLWKKEYTDCQSVGSVVIGRLKSLLYWVMAISGVTAILSLVFGQVIARNLATALGQLKRSAKQLEAGNYSTRLSMQRKDEFGKLGKTFNHLAENLEHSKIIEQQNEELEGLNEQLKVKNDSLDSFVYRVSHDLKAPVINLKSLLTMVHRQVDTEENKGLEKTLFFMEQSATRLEQTVYDLLEVSRIERHLKNEKEKVNVQDLIKEIIQENLTEINDSAANIICDFDAAPELFFARTNLKSILANLFTNSLKYRSPDRQPEIHLQTSRTADALCFSISDNGIGIDLEKYETKIFEMFSRFQNHVEGSGVGLYIVKKLVDENGAKLEVESQLDVGTSFKIYFALQEEYQETSAELML